MVHSLSISVPSGARRRRMPRAVHSALLAASLLATLTAAQAQPAATAARPDPLDPKASVPTLRYESSFAQYRRLGEEKPVSWRDANDTQQPDPAPTTAPAPAPAPAPAAKPADTPSAAKPVPMPAGHGGHKTP